MKKLGLGLAVVLLSSVVAINAAPAGQSSGMYAGQSEMDRIQAWKEQHPNYTGPTPDFGGSVTLPSNMQYQGGMPGQRMSPGSSLAVQQRLYNQLKPYLVDMDDLVKIAVHNAAYPYLSQLALRDQEIALNDLIDSQRDYLTDDVKDKLVFMFLSPVLAYSDLNGSSLSTDYQNGTMPTTVDISKCQGALTTNGATFICPGGQMRYGQMPMSAANKAKAQRAVRTTRNGF